MTSVTPAHIRLARSLAGRMKRRCPVLDLEELEGLALLGLARAARSFKADRGASFDTWVWRSIESSILDGVRMAVAGPYKRGDVERHRIGVAAPIRVSMNCAERMPAQAERADEVLARAQESASLRGAVARLSPRHRRLIEGYYFEGRPQSELVDGADKSWACRLLDRAESELRGILGVPAPDAKMSRARRRA